MVQRRRLEPQGGAGGPPYARVSRVSNASRPSARTAARSRANPTGAPSSGHIFSARGNQPRPRRRRMARIRTGSSRAMMRAGSEPASTRPNASAPIRKPAPFAASANPAPPPRPREARSAAQSTRASLSPPRAAPPALRWSAPTAPPTPVWSHPETGCGEQPLWRPPAGARRRGVRRTRQAQRKQPAPLTLALPVTVTLTVTPSLAVPLSPSPSLPVAPPSRNPTPYQQPYSGRPRRAASMPARIHLPGAHRDLQHVLPRRNGAVVVDGERTRRVVRAVEVQHEPVRLPGHRLRLEVPPHRIRLVPRGRDAEG